MFDKIAAILNPRPMPVIDVMGWDYNEETGDLTIEYYEGRNFKKRTLSHRHLVSWYESNPSFIHQQWDYMQGGEYKSDTHTMSFDEFIELFASKDSYYIYEAIEYFNQ